MKVATEDVNVTFEDQQKINKFACNTSRITELQGEIEVVKKKQLQNLEDTCNDILQMGDKCLMILNQVNSFSQKETQGMLEGVKKYLQGENGALVDSIQWVSAAVKVQLYPIFGSNINLEADES
ncbi:prefoldin subunit 4-like [Echinops telfairi]|uniref:Prefoldin subunit 4-like n=1 Tax=Echinops telfairi TaxID=9371 RepID=A0AC55DBB4_ECHTE|nr:prefoldin subunit 4-like [Echinops telfairi]